MKKLSMIFMTVLMLSVTFQGCKKDDGQAPELPPESTFVMDFSDFSDGSKGASTKGDDTTGYNNWGFAAFNVGAWNIVITLTAIVPVAAFREALIQKPAYDKELKKWVWSFEKKVGLVNYSCNLHGNVDGDQVIWEMYISRQNGVQNFKWYEGMSKLDGTAGSWTLYKGELDQNPLVGIEWSRNASEGTASIKYTNIVPNDAGNGGYILYGVTNDADYNRYYDIYNKDKDNLTSIMWNSVTKDGKVLDEKHYGDADTHCWNEQLQNIICK